MKPPTTVTFTESGLPAGTEWWVNLTNGQTFTSQSATITFSEPSGGYTYTLATTNKSYSAPGGIFTVHGPAVSESVLFSLVTYSVVLTESALPTGTVWWVNLTNGQSFNATTNTISFLEPNGTYVYAVATADTSYSAAGGSFPVNGAPVSVSVAFSLVTYAINFTEGGLPAGTQWWVNLTNGATFSSGTPTITLGAPNGTYTYGVASADKTYAATGGTFAVDGVPVLRTVTFARVTYSVFFTESGLPSGSEWWVNASGQVPQSSTGSVIALNLPNGTYTYSVTTLNKSYSAPAGSFAVDGNVLSEAVAFSFVAYPVTFTESGLPSGLEWWANVSGQAPQTSTGSKVLLYLPNETYTYRIATGDKTYAAPGGTFAVNGSPVSLTVTFARVTYPVIFTESGLPSGSEWWVNLTNGPSFAGTGPTISFPEPNGTYSYVVSSVGWAPTPWGGTLEVNGASASRSVSFRQATYAVAFSESGLANGTKWSVTIDGLTESSTTSTLVFNESNDTYSFTVGSVSGYRSNVTTGSVKVAGSARSIPLSFTSTSSGGSNSGLLPAGWSTVAWVVIGVVALAVVAAAFAVRRRRRGGATTAPPWQESAEPPPPQQT